MIRGFNCGWTRCALAAGLVLAGGPVLAGNGYFLNGAGANNRALSGAGAALAAEPMAMTVNPAAISRMPGDGWQIGVTFITGFPEVSAGPFTVPEGGLPPGAFPLKPGIYEQDADDPLQIGGVFAVPFGAISWRLDDTSTVGIGVYGNGGLNDSFQASDNPSCPPGTPQRGLFCSGDVVTNITQTFIAPTYARQLLPWLHAGASVLLVWQTLEVRGLGLFAPQSRDPDAFTNNGHDNSFGAGLKFGLQAEVTPKLWVGAAYQTRAYMSRFDDYAGLLADQGDFDVPPQIQVGIAWRPFSRWTLLFDYLHIEFTDIPALGNHQDAPGQFGDDDGPGFGWRDIDAYKFGVIYQASRNWTLRFGYSHTSQLLREDELLLSILAAGAFEHHISAGLSYRLGEAFSLDVAATHALEKEIAGPNPLYPDQELKLSNPLYSLDIGIRRHFY